MRHEATLTIIYIELQEYQVVINLSISQGYTWKQDAMYYTDHIVINGYRIILN